MRNKNALTRYRLIDTRMTMKQKPAPTLQDLIDYVSEKMQTTVSVATIQKDIYAMRYDESLGYLAPIEYDSYRKAYVYTDPAYSINHIPVSEEDLQGLEMAVGILQQFKNIPAIGIFEDAINKIAASLKISRAHAQPGGILLLDRPKRYLGIEFMADIVEAIQHKNVLRVHYHPHGKEIRKHTVHPYFIKEYQGRMYLIAQDIHPVKEAKFLTFAFDRMRDVIRMNQTFTEQLLDTENYFRSTIGISLPDAKPEIIELRFDPSQTAYLKSQPLHASQHILKETPTQLLLQVELVINYELKSLLLGMGDKVKVLKPASLAREMQETAGKMLAQYQASTR